MEKEKALVSAMERVLEKGITGDPLKNQNMKPTLDNLYSLYNLYNLNNLRQEETEQVLAQDLVLAMVPELVLGP